MQGLRIDCAAPARGGATGSARGNGPWWYGAMPHRICPSSCGTSPTSTPRASMRPIVFRDPENALMPNRLQIPIGYNARASSVAAGGSEVRRPLGQPRPPGVNAPVCGPCGKLTVDLEMGVGGGAPSDMGAPISIAEADSMIFAYVLLNDRSARDVQVRKYQPLGPFQSKTFATMVSPWVVTQQALEPPRFPVPCRIPSRCPVCAERARSTSTSICRRACGRRERTSRPRFAARTSGTCTGRARRNSFTMPSAAAGCTAAICSAPARSAVR